MTKVVISEFMDEGAVAELQKRYSVVYDATLVDDAARLADEVKDCDALIVRNRTQVRDGLLAAAGKLRVVGRLGVGLDNIALDQCKARQITVIPATGANNVSVAEYVMAGLLMMARGCYTRSAEVAGGLWPRNSMIGGEIYEKTLGIVGFGGIAREVARRARAFGMKLVAYDPFLPADHPSWKEYNVCRSTLEDLLPVADFVTLHVPLTPDTRHLMSAERLALMKKGACIINSARGGIIDDDALAAALISGQLGGAMLDVYEKEPMPADTAIGKAPNCYMTAHIGGVTRESNKRVSSLIAQKVIEALEA